MKITIIHYFKNCFFNIIIIAILATIVSACSISDFYSDDLNNSKIKNTSYNIVKCPTILIPKETYKHTTVTKNKKNRFKIEKVEVICKEENNKNKLLVDFKIYINSQTNFEANNNNNNWLPQIYLAIIDSRHEKVLSKIISKSKISSTETSKSNKIVNKGKFKVKYNNELMSDINIYVGFQKFK